MYKTRRSTSIDRPPQEVFDYITDPANDASWLSGTESSQFTSDPPHGVGAPKEVVVKMMGRRIETTNEITHWDRPNTYGFEAADGPIPFTTVVRLEAGGENQTEVTLDLEAEFSGFFKMAEGLVGKQFDKRMDGNLETLKLLLEAQQE